MRKYLVAVLTVFLSVGGVFGLSEAGAVTPSSCTVTDITSTLQSTYGFDPGWGSYSDITGCDAGRLQFTVDPSAQTTADRWAPIFLVGTTLANAGNFAQQFFAYENYYPGRPGPTFDYSAGSFTGFPTTSFTLTVDLLNTRYKVDSGGWNSWGSGDVTAYHHFVVRNSELADLVISDTAGDAPATTTTTVATTTTTTTTGGSGGSGGGFLSIDFSPLTDLLSSISSAISHLASDIVDAIKALFWDDSVPAEVGTWAHGLSSRPPVSWFIEVHDFVVAAVPTVVPGDAGCVTGVASVDVCATSLVPSSLDSTISFLCQVWCFVTDIYLISATWRTVRG